MYINMDSNMQFGQTQKREVYSHMLLPLKDGRVRIGV